MTSPLDILKSAIEGVLKTGAPYGTVRYAQLAQAYANYMVTSNEEPVLIDWWVYDGSILHGHVFGHPRLQRGEFVTTSAIVQPPKEWKRGETLRTMNTVYVLGTPLCERVDTINALGDTFEHLVWLTKYDSDPTKAKFAAHLGRLKQAIANLKVIE